MRLISSPCCRDEPLGAEGGRGGRLLTVMMDCNDQMWMGVKQCMAWWTTQRPQGHRSLSTFYGFGSLLPTIGVQVEVPNGDHSSRWTPVLLVNNAAAQTCDSDARERGQP